MGSAAIPVLCAAPPTKMVSMIDIEGRWPSLGANDGARELVRDSVRSPVQVPGEQGSVRFQLDQAPVRKSPLPWMTSRSAFFSL